MITPLKENVLTAIKPLRFTDTNDKTLIRVKPGTKVTILNIIDDNGSILVRFKEFKEAEKKHEIKIFFKLEQVDEHFEDLYPITTEQIIEW